MRLRPELTVDEAIRYLRKQGVDASLPIHYGYVLDPDQHLLGVVPTHTLFSSPAEQTIRDLMKPLPVSGTDDTDQELVGQLFREHGLFAVPVVDDAAPRHSRGYPAGFLCSSREVDAWRQIRSVPLRAKVARGATHPHAATKRPY